MELTIVDQLLIYLVEEPRNVPMAMRAAGHRQDEISVAWREAPSAGYTESTGLGMDRLTPAGKARASKVRRGLTPDSGDRISIIYQPIPPGCQAIVP